jgi:hypothetical protein
MAKFETFKSFKETFDGFSTGEKKFACKVNRFDSVTFKRTGEKWYFAMEHTGFGWEGLVAYRVDTDELFTIDGMDAPGGIKVDDELVATYGSTKDDCIDAMMGC